MRICYWSSDVCSSDLQECRRSIRSLLYQVQLDHTGPCPLPRGAGSDESGATRHGAAPCIAAANEPTAGYCRCRAVPGVRCVQLHNWADFVGGWRRSEEHTSELQSLMRISYAVLCLKKKTLNT